MSLNRTMAICLFATLICSCGGDTKPDKVSSKSVPAIAMRQLNVPALPTEKMKEMFASVSYIDYIFYNLPFSLSQDNEASIHANLGLISPAKLESLPAGCKPIGREFFQMNGEVAYEADLYFSEGCFGYVFMKDNKAIYANQVSEAGVKFYSNIISQANQTRNQVINGQQ